MEPFPTARATPEAAAPTPAEPAAPYELLYKGKPVAKEIVGWGFVGLSVALMVLGVALNHVLTGGTWVPAGAEALPQIVTGERAAYLTFTAYDLLTSGILVVSLVAMGAGFLQRTLASWWSLRVGALIALVGVAILARAWRDVLAHDISTWVLLAFVACLTALPFLARAALERDDHGHWLRAGGLVVFGLYWATQAMNLYAAEAGDFVNMTFALLAVPLCNYFAYHELLSWQRGENPRSLLWASGTAFITTGVYFVTHKIQVVSEWLIVVVAQQTTALLHFFRQGVILEGGDPPGSMIYYPRDPASGPAWFTSAGEFPVQIILACTAIQSIMIFVGGILALRAPRRGEGVSGGAKVFERLASTFTPRRLAALALTVPLIYVLNLFRNVIIIWMSGQKNAVGFPESGGVTAFVCDTFTDCQTNPALLDNYASFWFSHNIIGKGGSLVALIIIAFIVFRILPELYDSIIGLLDLKQRRGPLERWFRGSRPARGGAKPSVRAAATPAETAASSSDDG